MQELFPAECGRMDSPRVAWLKAHNLITWHTPGLVGDEECEFTGEPIKAWTCAYLAEDGPKLDGKDGTGDTEAEACAAYAIKNRLRMWNEVQS